MKRVVVLLFFVFTLAMPASALEFHAPEVPESGVQVMPEDTSSFADALNSLFRKAIETVYPSLTEAVKISTAVMITVLLLSVLKPFSGLSKRSVELGGVVMIASVLLQNTDSMIRLGAETVTTLSEYGKLLLPVMTAALAAQGAAATSAALYGGTAAFDLLLSSMISSLLVPLVYCYLALSAANSAIGEDILKKIRDFVKWIISWTLKTLLTIYTTYVSITGVISGTTDAIALKATKFTISTIVPVVGGILSDASEAVLVSAGLMKNAAGIYGILAVLAVFVVPFLRIGVHYTVLKITAAICGMFGTKQVSDLVEDFSSAMGFLLAMTGSACLMQLISTVCFMKGVG